MTTYYGLYGQKVQYLASDPTDVQTGQVWYNSTSATLKVRSVTTSGTWASGGNLATARFALSGAGTQTAGLAFGGYTGTAITAATEEYDGSAWTAGGNLGTARYLLAGAGIQTAALAFGGDTPGGITAASEEYDGTSWTAGGTMATPRFQFAGCGTQTAGLGFGGYNPGTGGLKNETESYNGLNDLFGNREYRTTLKSVRNTYDRLCQFIASDYAIEVTRRQFGGSTKDWRYDNETFIFCLTNKFCAIVRFLAPHGILITNIDDPLRWNIGDEITIVGSASNDGTYTINAISTDTGNTLLTVDESITMETGVECCFENTTTPFRIVEQGNVASDSGVMFAEYCLNLRITPARTALNHLHTVLTSYRNHLLGEMKFTSGNGNYIASIELSIVDCALEGAQALIENQDLSLDVVADAEENAPLLESEEITFDYPITYTQYKTIKANPYGLIGFSCGNQPTEYGWIQDFQYKPYEGMGQFTLVLKR